MTTATKGQAIDRRSSDWDLGFGAGNYFALAGGQAAGALLALAAVWLATRALGSSGYGGIAALIAASYLAGSLAVHWTATSVFRHGCEEFVETGRIAASFWNRLAILLLNLVLVISLSHWWMPPVARWLSIPSEARALVLIHLVTMALAVHVQQSLYAAKLPRVQSALQVIERASLVAVLATLVLTGRTSWLHVALAYAFIPVVPALAGFWRLRSLVFPLAPLDRAIMKHLIGFSYPLAFQLLVGYFSTSYLDAFFILKYMTTSDLGVYSLSYSLTGQFMQLPSIAGTLFTAFMITSETRGETERLKRFFTQVLPSVTLIWSILAALAAFAGSFIIGELFDASFQPGRKLLWPLMAAVAVATPVLVGLGPAANARKRTTIPAAAAAAAAVVNVALNVTLIPRFGLSGCAWATTGAYAAAVVVWALVVPRALSVSCRFILPAILPALVGAALSESGMGDTMALAGSLATGAVLALLFRRRLNDTFRAIAALPTLAPATAWWRSVNQGRWGDVG